MNQKKSIETLSRFFPVESVDYILGLCERDRFQLKIRRGRKSKLGDFRSSINGKPHVITINGDMNIYASLLIFLHELAHLSVWKLYGHSKKPHGTEWKMHFGQLIRDAVAKGYFHPSLKQSLIDYSYKVKASGMADQQLMHGLMLFDSDLQRYYLLEEIPDKGQFLTRSGRVFIKEERLRTRYKCMCLDSNKYYSFHPLARVVAANNKFACKQK